MSAIDLSSRLSFLRLDSARRAALAEAWRVVKPRMDEVLDAFYGQLLRTPQMADLLSRHAGRGQEWLRQAQRSHWERLFAGRFDEGYATGVRRIGAAHARIGIDPRWYMGGYALALQEIGRILGEARRWNGRRTGEMLAAVSTAVLLDMDLALEIYFEEARAESARARARVADAFEAEVGGLVGSSVDSGRRVEGDADVLAGISARTSARMASAAAASETASSGLQTIASASEEMSASVGEIGRQVREGARLTGMAAARAREASERVAALSSSAERIGAVVRTISEVAARTNLLALNATIEAARAGAAGKGFAVVASEVKDLARRSGREAEAIAAQVSAIQAETAAAVRMIEEIVSAIADADASATAISAAVDQQGVAAREIAQSVQDAVQGTLAAAAAVLETAGAARDLEDAARTLRGRSADLARDGAALKAGVEGFLARIRAA